MAEHIDDVPLPEEKLKQFEKQYRAKFRIETRVKTEELEKFDAIGREVRIVPLSDIKPEPRVWLWTNWIPLGALGLLAGPGGMGKSTLSAKLAADVTRGRLPGACFNRPRGVIISATEDSFEQDIVPRLMAAGADLTRVYSVNVSINETKEDFLKLPEDLPKLAEVARAHDVGLLILDPLTSRLSSRLDTHKDAEVRRALEPLAKLARDAQMSVLGLIHLNKGKGSDPNSRVIGSAAFSNVGRFTLMVARDEESSDEENENVYALGLPKGNHSPTAEILFYKIEGDKVPTDEGDWIPTSKVVFIEKENARSFVEIFHATSMSSDTKERDEAKAFIVEYFRSKNSTTVSAIEIVAAATDDGHNEKTLRRAADDVKIDRAGRGKSGVWTWTQASDRAAGLKLTEPGLQTGGQDAKAPF
jgi:RecA-family ATPase